MRRNTALGSLGRTSSVVAVASLVVAVALLVLTPASPSSAAQPRAQAVLVDAAGARLGTVTFLGYGSHATKARVLLRLPAGAPNLGSYHGLHVHATGTCTPPFTTAGGHWDDGTHTHGGHLGDLASVLVMTDGKAAATFATDRIDISALTGRSVILHAGADNFGNVPVGAAADQYTANSADAVTATNATGNAGARYGCGVIELVGND